MSTTKRRRLAFTAARLTPSTFLIQEYDDIFSEHPYIYAKIVPSAETILLIDTGCGGQSNDPHIEIYDLREFIETVDIEDNDGKPLNGERRLKYVVVTTHCHYDHILAVEQFNDSTILASSHSPEFLLPEKMPDHTLCDSLGIATPSYTPKLVPHFYQIKSADGTKDLGVRILHTPGHTPDELALYDVQEKMLYVGDTLYEKTPIIFPKEGSIVEWLSSMKLLVSLVREEEEGATDSPIKVRINAGHDTANQLAMDVLQGAQSFMIDVIGERIAISKRWIKRGEETVFYQQEGGRFSLVCPERLVLDARTAQ